MATVEENRDKWNTYDWPQDGDEWSQAWGDSNQVWWAVLYPRIGRYLPTGTVLEIASGFGRWTGYLKQFCQQYVGIDVSETAISASRKKFPDLTFHLTDGVSLPVIKERSISFCFSYDSLVHIDRDTIRAYILELDRILTNDGIAFIHHSNLGAYKDIVERKRFWAKIVPSWRWRKYLQLIPETHWRDPEVTADFVRELCEAKGLDCRQELISWLDTDGLLIDCFTLISRAPLPYARMENPDLGLFASRLKNCSGHYVAPAKS